MEPNNVDRINGGNKPYHKLTRLDLNAIPRGNASQIRLWIGNIEASVIANTPKSNNFILTIMPFGWECSHNEEPEDDINLGIPGSKDELGKMITNGRFIGDSMERVEYHKYEAAPNKLSGLIKDEANDIEGDTCDALKLQFVKYFSGGRSQSTLANFFKVLIKTGR